MFEDDMDNLSNEELLALEDTDILHEVIPLNAAKCSPCSASNSRACPDIPCTCFPPVNFAELFFFALFTR